MRIPVRFLADDEEVVLACRRHGAVLLPVLAWATLLAGLVGVAIAALEPRHAAVAGAGALLLWLLTSVRSLARWWRSAYVLTTAQVLVRHGWWWRTATAISLEDVTGVQTERRGVARLLGYGDVLLTTPWLDGDVWIEAVADPEWVRAEIQRSRSHRVLSLGDRA